MTYRHVTNIFLLIVFVLFLTGYSQEIKNQRQTLDRFNDAIYPTAQYISDHFAEDSKLCVYFDAGYIPYKTKLQTLDLSGLLNKDLAANEYHNKNRLPDWRDNVFSIFQYRMNYMFTYSPDVVVISSRTNDALTKDAFIERLKSSPNWKHYKQVASFGSGNYYEIIYTNKQWYRNEKRNN